MAMAMAGRSRSVFVGNIPYDTSEEQVRQILSEVGPVVNFRLVIDPSTGKTKGYGFCEYKDEETAESARRNLHGYDIGGRQLRVDFADTDKVTGKGGGQRPPQQQYTGGPPHMMPPPLGPPLPLLPPGPPHPFMPPIGHPAGTGVPGGMQGVPGGMQGLPGGMQGMPGAVGMPQSLRPTWRVSVLEGGGGGPPLPPSQQPGVPAPYGGGMGGVPEGGPYGEGGVPVCPTHQQREMEGRQLEKNDSGKDQLSNQFAGMSRQQLYDLLAQMKALIETNREQARATLIANPQLTKALFQAQLMLGMVKPTTLVDQQPIIEEQSQQQAAAAQPQMDPAQKQALLDQVMRLTPEQINALPPEQRAQVLQLQQAMR